MISYDNPYLAYTEVSYSQHQMEESMNENKRLQISNRQLTTQLNRYEEVLTKMNQEYEKLLVQNTTENGKLSCYNQWLII